MDEQWPGNGDGGSARFRDERAVVEGCDVNRSVEVAAAAATPAIWILMMPDELILAFLVSAKGAMEQTMNEFQRKKNEKN